MALNDAREQYDRVITEKETIMLIGIEKKKKTKQLESENVSPISSFMVSREYGETQALDFIGGFWYEDEYVKQFHPEYGRFFIPGKILSALSHISLRSN